MRVDLELQPTYVGVIETRDDAVALIQACLRGSLHVVRRRPTSSERPSVAQSGHVFIYEEKASGIQRWTDGRRWSPSRVSGAFFIYGEQSSLPDRSPTVETKMQTVLVQDGPDGWPRVLYGPLTKSLQCNPDSLVKKTIRVTDDGNAGAIWHVVSYYRPAEVLQGRWSTPSMNPDFVLPPWHLLKNSASHKDASNDHGAGANSLPPVMYGRDPSQANEHHGHPEWPMWTNWAPTARRVHFSASGLPCLVPELDPRTANGIQVCRR